MISFYLTNSKKLRSIVRWTMLSVMCALSQITLAQTTPTITLGTYNPDVQVSQLKFTEPTIVIKDGSGTTITGRFRITYKMRGATEYTTDKDGRTITTDPVTGTTITQFYGRPIIGDKKGTATVEITATPLETYTSLYTSATTSYPINVAAPTVTATVSPKENMGAVVGQTIPTPTFTLSYKDNTASADSHDVTSNFTITGSVTAGSEFITLGTSTITANAAGTATITYTFTPKAGYEGTYNTFTKDVTVTVSPFTSKLKTQVVFPVQNMDIYRWPSNFYVQAFKVYDEYGNDVTSSFNPVYRYENLSDNPVVFKYWIDWWNDTDRGYVRVYNSYDRYSQQSGVPATINVHATATSNSNLYENATDGYFTLNILKRVPTMIFDVDPSTRNISAGTEYTPETISKVTRAEFVEPDGTTSVLTYGGNNGGDTFAYSFAFLKSDVDAGKVSLTGIESWRISTQTINGKEWTYINAIDGWGNNTNWKIVFNESGSYEMLYQLVPWNHVKWDIGENQIVTNKVTDKITGYMTITPKEHVVYVNAPFNEPGVYITDDFGSDIKDKFKLTYTLSDPNNTGTTIDATTGEVTIGGNIGTVIVTVTATDNTGTNKYATLTDTYVIHVMDSTGKFAYEIIDSLQPTDLDQGKLRFTGAGTVPGGYTIDGVPGLIVKIGNTTDTEWRVTDYNGRLVSYDGNLELDATTGIPTGGTYYELTPRTNGFLTIDANLSANSNTTLLRVADGAIVSKEVYTPTADLTGEATFKYPLIAGDTYYLYTEGTGGNVTDHYLHGIAYTPAWIISATNESPVTQATAFVNGYTGTLPNLIKWESTLVTFSTTTNGVATINATTGFVKPIKGGTETVSAKVTSGEKPLVYKNPIYELVVADIPTYVVQDLDVLSPGDTISTTNHTTRITMTVGGWEDGVGPYYKMVKGSDGILTPTDPQIDSWKVAKEDLIRNQIDGFVFQSQGAINPTDENSLVYSSSGKSLTDLSNLNTFNLPCRGTYLRFEPRESGVLMVYVLQSGACDWDSGKSDNNPDYKYMKYRPLFITDETGQSVTLDNSWKYDGSNLAYSSANPNYGHTGYYTINTCRANYADQTWDWSKFIGPDGAKTSIENAWKDKTTSTIQEVVKLANGGYTTITKAYVRYTLQVKAGKSYYVFQNGSKLGFAGFAFVPTGWTASRDAQYAADPTYNPVTETVNLDQSKAYTVPTAEKNNVKVTINRNFSAGVWNSICLPFSVSETQFKEVFGEDANILTYDSLAKDTFYFKQHTYHMIEAGRPYLVRSTKDITNLTFNNVTIETGITAPKGAVTSGGLTFKGLFAPEQLGPYSYYVNGKLYHTTTTVANPMPSYRAYFYNESGTEVLAKSMSLMEASGMADVELGAMDVISTDISTVIDNRTDNGHVYNMQGQVVRSGSTDLNGLPKGIYVVNGRKTVVQ